MAVIDSCTRLPSRQDSAARVAAQLPDDYYVQALLVVLDTVLKSSGDLLAPQEHEWVIRLKALTDGARRLYVRLLQRRGSTFRQGKLAYPDVPDVASAAIELVQAGLADDRAPGALQDLVKHFSLRELDTLTPVDGPRARRRSERVRAIVERQQTRDIDALASADRWLTIHGHKHFAVFRLCFFGNLHQDLSAFVTTALGKHHYAQVPMNADTRFFRSRAQLDAHLRYFECSMLFEQAPRAGIDALHDLVAGLPADRAGDQHLERRLDRLRIELARAFERLGEDEPAAALYRACHRAPARERHVRLLQRNDRHDDAQGVLSAMYDGPECEAEFDFACRHLVPGSRAAKAFRPRTTTLVLPASGSRVEAEASRYFARDGSCHWVENRLFCSLLGLWIWDIVFMPVRGAFFNPFQSAPADFRERSFRRLRAAALDERFAELEQPGALEQRVRDNLQRHAGISNPLVRWDVAGSLALEHALQRIPQQALGVVFDRMLDDLAEHTSGFPDLVHFPEAGGYELIEIKGPGDALQSHQRRWLRHFDAHAIPARVVKLRWTHARG